MNRFNSKFNIEEYIDNKDFQKFYLKLPNPLNSIETIFTAYGRNALYQGLKSFEKISSKRTILIPNYTCGDEVAAIINAGFRVKVYEVFPDNLQVDFSNLKKNITQDSAGVLVTHYFGFPQKEISEIKLFCQENKMFLLEDCAHTVGGRYENKFLGTFGDLSIFSLRKFYPIPHGGALIINNKEIPVPHFLKPSVEAVTFDLAIFLGYRTGLLEPGNLPEVLRVSNKENSEYGPRLSRYGGYELGLSDLSRWIISRWGGKLEERNETFNYYLSFFKNNISNLRPLYPIIEPEIIPLFFPILVDNSTKFCQKLTKRGIIICQPFWSHLHGYINWKEYPAIRKLKERVVVLPLSHRLSEGELTNILGNG